MARASSPTSSASHATAAGSPRDRSRSPYVVSISSWTVRSSIAGVCPSAVHHARRVPHWSEHTGGTAMRTDDLILVSIDDHVIEPRDMFERHVPAKYRDVAPRVVTDDAGVEQWVFQGEKAG